MRVIFSIKSFLMIVMLMCCSLYSFGASESSLNRMPTGIDKVIGQKVYLKAGSVQIAKNGIFINIEESLIPVNHLELDDQGVYFDVSKLKGGDNEVCFLCGWPLLWGFCVNPDCPSKK